MIARQRRMLFVGLIVAGVAAAVTLGLSAFQENVLYYVTPSQVMADHTSGKTFRLGGMVKDGSVYRAPGSLQVRFVVTDLDRDLPVTYTGVLPDLFREGQGVIARGKIIDGAMQAEEVLAKHDEKYMPPEMAEKIKQRQTTSTTASQSVREL
jgi:cytochrome c-type biogenesis protein CcmE